MHTFPMLKTVPGTVNERARRRLFGTPDTVGREMGEESLERIAEKADYNPSTTTRCAHVQN